MNRLRKILRASGSEEGFSSKAQEINPKFVPSAVMRVIGAGGGGGNAVNRMISGKFDGVDFIVANTDVKDLNKSLAPTKVQIGKSTTGGLGCGSDPECGRKSAEENEEELRKVVADSDMVFVTCGLGGGTGTGSAPVIASIAKEMGILTIGVVTRPFAFEGLRRKKNADTGFKNLKANVDALITIPNDSVMKLVSKTTPLKDSFIVVDDVLRQGIEGISSIIGDTGLVGLDFADVQSVMKNAGSAMMGIGYGSGEDRAVTAARSAIDSPLLEVSIDGAKGIILSITGGNDLSLHEVNEAATIITESADPDANVIFGAVINEEYSGEVKITVIATGFDDDNSRQKSSIQSSFDRGSINKGQFSFNSVSINKGSRESESDFVQNAFGNQRSSDNDNFDNNSNEKNVQNDDNKNRKDEDDDTPAIMRKK